MQLLTFQDFEKLGNDEDKRTQFVYDCIQQHKNSDEYKAGLEYKSYYEGINPHLEKAQNIIYDLLGNARQDNITPNHKIYSKYVQSAITEGTQYLLGNGISFDNDSTKNALGDDFDDQAVKWADEAQIYGVSWGYWNGKRLEILPFLQVKPLPDEFDGSIKAAVRFWQIADGKPLRAVLYETDGYTEFIQISGEKMRIETQKRGYPKMKSRYGVAGVKDQVTEYQNYPALPVIPLYYINRRSILYGNTSAVDAYDLLTSKMVNNIDEGNLVYWVLRNCNSMSEQDLENFFVQLHKTHVIPLDGANEGSDATPHQIEAPVNSTEIGISRIKQVLDGNFMVADMDSIRAGNITATQIRASFHRLEMKTARFEYQMLEAIRRLLYVVGMPNEKFTFQWAKEINKSEEITSIIQASQFLDEETTTQMILEVLGKVDLVNDVKTRKQEDGLKQYNLNQRKNEQNVSRESEK